MPFYSLALIYSQGTRGFIENFYRQADSARQAGDFGGAAGLAPFLISRPFFTRLQAIRAQEETGLKRLHLRLHWLEGNKNLMTPNVTSVAAKFRLHFEGGGSRGLEFRGVDDSLVSRLGDGRPDPAPEFLLMVQKLSDRIQELQLRGRRLVKHPKHIVHSYGPHPESSALTLVRLRFSDFAPAPGSYVDFGGGRGLDYLQPERGYLVLDSEPGWLSVWRQWRDTAPVVGNGRVWVRQLEYDYPRLGPLELADFGSYATGPAYRPASWAALEPWRCPISPCGRIVDFVRTTHDGDMAVFRSDSSVTLRVRWYFPELLPDPQEGQPRTVEEIPAVPHEHPFGSRLWEQHGDFLPSLGMRYTDARNSGRPSALLRGVGLCGSPDAWTNGAAADEPFRPLNATTGQPCCCGPGAWIRRGGAAGGGNLLPKVLVAGGAAGGGAAEVLHLVAGGAAAGGEAWPLHLVRGGAAAGGRAEVLHEVRGGAGGSGRIPADDPGPCTYVYKAPAAVVRVTISGATGAEAVANGTWTIPWEGGCLWRLEGGVWDFLYVELQSESPDILVIVHAALSGFESRFYQTVFPELVYPLTVESGGGNPDLPATVLLSIAPGKPLSRGDGGGRRGGGEPASSSLAAGPPGRGGPRASGRGGPRPAATGRGCPGRRRCACRCPPGGIRHRRSLSPGARW